MSNQPINDGGTEIQSTGSSVNVGLQVSLRDYFAAAALQGLMSKVKPEAHWEDYRAKWSYEAADAMLKAREAK
jgi:hypothetical protein